MAMQLGLSSCDASVSANAASVHKSLISSYDSIAPKSGSLASHGATRSGGVDDSTSQLRLPVPPLQTGKQPPSQMILTLNPTARPPTPGRPRPPTPGRADYAPPVVYEHTSAPSIPPLRAHKPASFASAPSWRRTLTPRSSRKNEVRHFNRPPAAQGLRV
jgi:hypothetical protein